MVKPQQVQGIWYTQNFLKTLQYDWSQCYQPVVIQAAGWALSNWEDGCGPGVGGYGALVEGKVEDVGKNSKQFTGPCSKSPPRDVICSCCLTGMKG